jgi:DNA mismatch repair protein MutL
MTGFVRILPDSLVNKIAAGEVVERPASVVKELVENSLDAGATEVSVDVEQAGRRLIRVTDNGSGMSREDARLCFERHATSKIASEADLEAIRTMGFRGEALSSIAAVAHVRMVTAVRGATSGVMVEIEGGSFKAVTDAAAPQGTSFEVGHLFYNTPARLKFLKSPATEFSHILSALSHQALAHPEVRFRLTHNKKTVLDLPSSGSRKERAFQLYGADLADQLVEFSGGRSGVAVFGLFGKPSHTRGDRTYQDFYVNRRFIRNPSLTHALYAAYSDMLMRDRHPVAFVFIDLDPAAVDVNVHPAKAEVRFRNQSEIHDIVRDVIREGLRGLGVSSSPPGADRVREAVSEYLESAERGMRSAEFGAPSSEFGVRSAEFENATSPEGHRTTIAEHSRFSVPESFALHSEIRTPHSALLFPLAQIHDSFIIAQSRDGMALIDQHAAHERVLFEKLQDQFNGGSVSIQQLLLPDQVELGPAEAELLTGYLPELGRIGLVVEDFGGGTFVIKAVPALLTGGDYRQLLRDILDEIRSVGTSAKMERLRDEILSVMACHPAIKINRRLDPKEMTALVSDLFACRNPHTCPHGRPTVVRFSIEEIRKMFKRT